MNRWIIIAAILGLTTACDSDKKDAAPEATADAKTDAKGDAKADAKGDAKGDAKADGDTPVGVVVDPKGGATPTPLPGL